MALDWVCLGAANAIPFGPDSGESDERSGFVDGEPLWCCMVIQQLNAEQTELLRSCLEAPGPDVRVVFCLREGAVLLEVSNAGRRLELYREDVTSGNRMSRRGQSQGAGRAFE